MADFISALTGVQMDQALLDMAEHNSEAYAVGERNGIAVASDDVTYHNNARYYAQIASSQIVGDASSAVRWDTDQSEVLTDAQKAVARNNINAASDSDVVKITSQTLTSAEQSQARANIMAGGSNRNLLDNPWFTVNQRSAGSTSDGYPADRWLKVGNTAATATATANGLVIALNGSVYCDLRNRYSEAEIITPNLGKTATISIMLADGTVFSDQIVLSTTQQNRYLNSEKIRFNLSVSDGVYLVRLVLYDDMTIRAVKLELGSVSTLANDAPPDYASELIKCQYYFQRIKGTGTNYGPVGVGYALSTSSAAIIVPLAAPLRRTTVTVSSSGNLSMLSGGTAHTPNSVSYYDHTDQQLRLNCVVSNSLTSGNYCYLQFAQNTAYIDLSADL